MGNSIEALTSVKNNFKLEVISQYNDRIRKEDQARREDSKDYDCSLWGACRFNDIRR